MPSIVDLVLNDDIEDSTRTSFSDFYNAPVKVKMVTQPPKKSYSIKYQTRHKSVRNKP
jgi:hypothetical protein